jgi:transposase
MENSLVPFTNNRGENDIRMTKVQQKISGCFRREEEAKILCRVRGYLSTCRKQKINASQALRLVLRGSCLTLFSKLLLSFGFYAEQLRYFLLKG